MIKKETLAGAGCVAVALVLAVGSYLIPTGNKGSKTLHSVTHTSSRKTVKIHHLKDGRYYFRDHDDDIYYWYFISANSGTESTLSTFLPREGQWVRSALPPEEELEEGQFETDITVNEETGAPIAEVESQAVGDGTDTNSGAAEAPSAPADSGSTDSGTSDSGGGDSGGGDCCNLD
jgi:hypothetical protein